MISWVAIDRIMERKIASDATYRRQAAGRPLRSHGQRLTDGELLGKLRAFGIDLDRASLEPLCAKALSAEEIVTPLLAQRTFTQRKERESDWIWICVSTLWQRWFPDRPSFELLDDRMQAGYDLLESGQAVAACRMWLEAWTDVLRLLDQAGMRSIAEFDRRFRGTQSLFNWIQELEGELWNAGLEDRYFLTVRIAVCEEGLRRFAADDQLLTENWRRALAESYYELGETDRAEALYRDWLTTDPRWGWGWIGWSDCYRFTRTELKDLNRSEQRLREGLAIPDVRDRPDLAERLADLYDEQGRSKEATECRRQAARRAPAMQTTLNVMSGGTVLRRKTTITFGGEGVPLSELANVDTSPQTSSSEGHISTPKVGRNAPCPCGSGKKFKRCCGGGPSTV